MLSVYLFYLYFVICIASKQKQDVESMLLSHRGRVL